MAWILTDNDSMQHARRLDGQCWQLIEMALFNPDMEQYQVYIDDVNVTYYIDKEREKLDQILACYGYPSVEFVFQEHCGFHGYQVIAECVFEHYNTQYARRLFIGSEDECVGYINNYVKETNEVWYRADFVGNVESEYFIAVSDEAALEYAQNMDDVEYVDAPPRKRDLVQLVEVDSNTEFFNDVRLVWW